MKVFDFGVQAAASACKPSLTLRLCRVYIGLHLVCILILRSLKEAGILVRAAAANDMTVLVHCRVSFSSFVAASGDVWQFDF